MKKDPRPKSEIEALNHTSHNDPYCEFKDDSERRDALMYRDIRIVICRFFTVSGLVIVALFTPFSAVVGIVVRLLAWI